MSLNTYKKKRHFSKTPEPTGGKSVKEQLIFVVQKHQASHLHYDFRIELRGVLKSWAVPKGPSLNPAQKRLAQLVEDHPFDYKDFEGLIPEGNYGAGTVIIWDQGTYEPTHATGDKEQDEKTMLRQFFSGKISIVLKGKKLKGRFTLVKTPSRGHNSWLLSKIQDRHAKEDIDITQRDLSVVSGLTIEDMEDFSGANVWQSNREAKPAATTSTTKRRSKTREKEIVIEPPSQKDYQQIIDFIKRDLKGHQKTKMPSGIAPMLATKTDKAFDDPDWLFEIKWDGYRCLAYLGDGKAKIRSRQNHSLNKTYPLLVEALQQWPISAIVDGEIVVLSEEGKPDFGALQNYGNMPGVNLAYYVFDIIWIDGVSLLNLPLEKRKTILQKIVPDTSLVKYSDSIDEVGTSFFEVVKNNDLEGIVAKRKQSLYLPGKRTADWLKIQAEKRQEFVIGGWIESDSGRPFKTLLFGYYQNGKLLYYHHGGGGFKEEQMPGILNQLQSIEIKKNPFANEVNEEGRIHWVQPQLVAEFKYTKTTKKGSIRHPAIFLGFRPDKDPEEVVLELPVSTHNHQSPAQRKMESNPSALPDEGWEAVEKKQITSKEEINVEGHTITLTNIEQELWKGITKAHLIAYYNSMAGYLLPYLEDRPLGLNISPNGPFKDSVFIRGLEGHYPSWARVFTTDRKHKKRGKSNTIDWLVCNDLATLMYMINIDCIDLHPWCSKVGSPNYPDYISIDLDPSDDDFSKVIETALAAKELFSKFKLTSFVKTSGKTGMHIFVPCTGIAFGEARSIAENICNQIQALVPYITTTETSISARGDKLYIDPSQNDYGDRLAAPYCVRAYKLPTVSTPLDWKEVARRLDPTDYTIRTITKRIEKKGDLWKDLFSKKVIATNAKILKSFL